MRLRELSSGHRRVGDQHGRVERPPEIRRESDDDSALEALADRMEAERDRTSVRRLNEQALAREAYDAACPHCACYMHAECCYCDGGQVHK